MCLVILLESGALLLPCFELLVGARPDAARVTFRPHKRVLPAQRGAAVPDASARGRTGPGAASVAACIDILVEIIAFLVTCSLREGNGNAPPRPQHARRGSPSTTQAALPPSRAALGRLHQQRAATSPGHPRQPAHRATHLAQQPEPSSWPRATPSTRTPTTRKT